MTTQAEVNFVLLSQVVNEANACLDEQLSSIAADQKVSQGSISHLEQVKHDLEQQLRTSHFESEAAQTKLKANLSELSTRNSELMSQQSTATSQLHQLQQQQSSDALELTARNAGLLTQLSLMQQQHAEALSRVSAEVTKPLGKQLASLKQQLKISFQKLHSAEQQLSAHESTLDEAEAQATRAEGLLKKAKERRSSMESDKRRLQASLKEARAEVSFEFRGKFHISAHTVI